MLLRLFLLLGIAAGLALFAWSNLQPLALTFLGIQTPALPLSFWVLGAIAAGIATHLLIGALFGLSNFITARNVRSQFRAASRRRDYQPPPPASGSSSYAEPAKSSDDSTWQNWDGYEPTDRKQADTSAASEDDWESSGEDDWGDTSDTPPRPQSPPRDRTNYEATQTPQNTDRAGSVYSYSYRDPAGTSGAGSREKVVDADYRVIVPPYQPVDPQPSTEENADDWFDDDFETDEERERRTRSS